MGESDFATKDDGEYWASQVHGDLSAIITREHVPPNRGMQLLWGTFLPAFLSPKQTVPQCQLLCALFPQALQ